MKKLKQSKFSKKEFENLYAYFKWYLMNYCLSKIHEVDLSYKTLFKIAKVLELLDTEVLFLGEQKWLENSIKKIKNKTFKIV